jgi:hypothetical protein
MVHPLGSCLAIATTGELLRPTRHPVVARGLRRGSITPRTRLITVFLHGRSRPWLTGESRKIRRGIGRRPQHGRPGKARRSRDDLWSLCPPSREMFGGYPTEVGKPSQGRGRSTNGSGPDPRGHNTSIRGQDGPTRPSFRTRSASRADRATPTRYTASSADRRPPAPQQNSWGYS